MKNPSDMAARAASRSQGTLTVLNAREGRMEFNWLDLAKIIDEEFAPIIEKQNKEFAILMKAMSEVYGIQNANDGMMREVAPLYWEIKKIVDKSHEDLKGVE